MKPEQLKASIIKYAIQGKLVEQHANEGNATELCEEARRLRSKKGKVSLKDKNDEIPFDIPETWEWVRLDEIAFIEAGGTPSRTNADYWNGNIPWVKIGDINSKYVTSASEYISEKGLNNSSAKIFKKGTVLYTIFATIGTVGILDFDAATNQAIAGITLCGDISTEYFYYVAVGIKDILVSQAHGMAQMNINQGILKNTYIPIPPYKEQLRIVSKLSEILPLIDSYAEAYEKLEQFNAKFPEDMKKSILQYAIQGKLVEQRPEEGTAEELYHQIQAEKQKLIKEGKIKKEKPIAEITEDEIPFDIPESWKWVRVCSVGVTQTGNTPKKTHPEYFGNYIPFLGPGDIQNGNVNYDNQGLSEEGKEYGRVTPSDSVLQVCIGGSIGKCALVDREVTFNQQINSIYPLISDSKYVYYVLDSYYFKDYMKENSGGTATPIINRGLWDAIVIPLPPLEEQHRIVAKIEELLPFCERLVK